MTTFAAVAAEAIRRPKASERTALRLVQYIADEGLPEGTVLPTEARMMRTLGVGRTTLREALRLLETQGVLTIRTGPHGGPVVRSPRPDDLRGSMTLFLQSHDASFATLMQSRVVIEPAVAAAAARVITTDGIVALEENLATMDAERARRDRNWMHSNEQFHVLVAAMCGNQMLHMIVATIVAIFTSQQLEVHDEERRLGVSHDHRAVIEALKVGSPERAHRAMTRHLNEAYSFYEGEYPDVMQRPIRWTW